MSKRAPGLELKMQEDPWKQPWEPDTATLRIREMAEDKWGDLKVSANGKARMTERGITMADIRDALANGQVTGNPEFHQIHHQWHYRIRGRSLGSGTGWTELVVALVPEDRVIIVLTGWWIRQRLDTT